MRKPHIHSLSFPQTKADTQRELLISWVTSFLVKIFYCCVKFIVLLKTPFPENCHSLSKRKGSHAPPGSHSTWKCRDSQSLTVTRQPSVGPILLSQANPGETWGLSSVRKLRKPPSVMSTAASSEAQAGTVTLSQLLLVLETAF